MANELSVFFAAKEDCNDELETCNLVIWSHTLRVRIAKSSVAVTIWYVFLGNARSVLIDKDGCQRHSFPSPLSTL